MSDAAKRNAMKMNQYTNWPTKRPELRRNPALSKYVPTPKRMRRASTLRVPTRRSTSEPRPEETMRPTMKITSAPTRVGMKSTAPSQRFCRDSANTPVHVRISILLLLTKDPRPFYHFIIAGRQNGALLLWITRESGVLSLFCANFGWNFVTLPDIRTAGCFFFPITPKKWIKEMLHQRSETLPVGLE